MTARADQEVVQTGPPDAAGVAETPLLRLFQLISPALPIGAFAHSQGLETATEMRWVYDHDSAAAWITGLLANGLGRLDAPILYRLIAAWRHHDRSCVQKWNDFLLAARGSAELQAEDGRMGDALGRTLRALGLPSAHHHLGRRKVTHATAFAQAVAAWDIPPDTAVQGYLFSWVENQVAASIRLVPLGQSDGQRITAACIDLIPGVCAQARNIHDEDLGTAAPLQVIASALHESQYSRLFRS